MTRYRAFAIHLLVSAIVVGCVAGLTAFVWYPEPYLYLNAADSILLLLIGVDVIAGPTLTLIVFKPGKPGLKTDMIVTVQLLALLYGTATLYQERPLFLVFAVDRFELVTAAEIDINQIRYPELKDLPVVGPGIAVAQQPRDRKLRQEIFLEVLLQGGVDIERRPQLYEPLSLHKDRVVASSAALEKFLVTETDRARLREFLARHNARPEDFAYLPLVGKVPDRDMLLAVDANSAMPVGGIKVSPWSRTKQRGN